MIYTITIGRRTYCRAFPSDRDARAWLARVAPRAYRLSNPATPDATAVVWRAGAAIAKVPVTA